MSTREQLVAATKTILWERGYEAMSRAPFSPKAARGKEVCITISVARPIWRPPQ